MKPNMEFDISERMLKQFKGMLLGGCLSQFFITLIIIIAGAILLVAPMLFFRNYINKIKEGADEVIEKVKDTGESFWNFVTFNGWNTNEESFYKKIKDKQEDYSSSVKVDTKIVVSLLFHSEGAREEENFNCTSSKGKKGECDQGNPLSDDHDYVKMRSYASDLIDGQVTKNEDGTVTLKSVDEYKEWLMSPDSGSGGKSIIEQYLEELDYDIPTSEEGKKKFLEDYIEFSYQKKGLYNELMQEEDEKCETDTSDILNDSENSKGEAAGFKIASYLYGKGWTKHGIAGLLGNLEGESSIDPGMYSEWDGKNNTGLCSWIGGRVTNLKNFAKKNNRNYKDLYTQVDFILYELKTEYKGWEKEMKNSKSYKTSASWFMLKYERPKSKDPTRRIGYAKKWYNKIKDKSLDSDPNSLKTYSSSSSLKTVAQGKKYKLSDDQIKQLASLCKQEQGSVAGAAAEASLMANRFEKHGKGYSSLYNYVKNSKWWAKAATYMSAKNASSDIVAAVKNVLVGGQRTLALSVDEHDCWDCNPKKSCPGGFKGDICKIVTNGKTYTSLSDIKNRKNYVKGKTIIHNVYGSTYTFYSFPSKNSNPFGSTNGSVKETASSGGTVNLGKISLDMTKTLKMDKSKTAKQMLGSEAAVKELNNKIKNNVDAYGRGTGNGVAAAAITLLNGFKAKGYRLGYVYGGIGHPTTVRVGVDPNKSNVMDCSAFVSWAIRNGGCKKFKTSLSSGQFPPLGKKVAAKDAKPGDVYATSGHVALVVKNDNGKPTYAEAKAPSIGIVFSGHTGRRVREGAIYSMTDYYNKNCDPQAPTASGVDPESSCMNEPESGGEAGSTGTGDYTTWRQSHAPWSNIKLGHSSETISKSGCLATSVAILIAKSGVKTNVSNFNPGTFVKAMTKNGGFDGAALKWGVVSTVAPKFKYVNQVKISTKTKANIASEVKKKLDEGYYVTLEVGAKQHWVAVEKVEGNKILVIDPAGRVQSHGDVWSAYKVKDSDRYSYFKVEG